MFDVVWRSVAIGIGATALTDIWAIILNRAFGLALPNWGMVGRWVWHLQGGKVFHDDIVAAGPFAQETALGWLFHYAVGIIYGCALVAIMGPGWLAAPTLLPAWILGLVTVSAGWFLLAPGMGAGWAAAKRPNPMQIRSLNLVSHTIFGFGLYATALLIR